MMTFNKFYIFSFLLGFSIIPVLSQNIPDADSNPNIVIIVADDQGYADVSFHDHPNEISTPAIDRLAEDGVVFSNGYASAYVCAPTRAGLLTGKYQQRFGFYKARDSRKGMPLSEKTIANYLSEEGYVSGIFGKWHLGLEYDYRPLQRGFDEFYGFLGHGAHSYFDLDCEEDQRHNCIYRNNEIIEDEGYLTDILAEESCNFIEKQARAEQPFFLYLPFNAVHFPLEAPQEDINRFTTEDSDRNIMLAMLYRMDLAVGKVIDKLKSEGLYENTLIFYFSDNGGARKIHANNMPLRDYKQSTYEGGIRVPFIISWPAKFEPGKRDEPVITIDILPTILDVLNILTKEMMLDGRSILPAINGKLDNPLHDFLFWDGDEEKWAVRSGDFKLVKNNSGHVELYNINKDIGESNNIIESNNEMAEVLLNEYRTWRNSMSQPMKK